MYSGQIESVGPRYCPSIEDKVVRFADNATGTRSSWSRRGSTIDTVYPNGISTSLPREVQAGAAADHPGAGARGHAAAGLCHRV